MQYDPARHNRQSFRLKGYDYGKPGAYFFTLCLQNRNDWLFGSIKYGEMRLNEFGAIILDEWRCTPDIRCEIALDSFVVMPNHIHGILWITHDVGQIPVGADGRPP
ncbi:MAG TPA: hypothetical protein DCQ83_07065, partial [Fibrobacteres bacterium]|nr:hypothetical protein [Fibrobacterota bacterium]